MQQPFTTDELDDLVDLAYAHYGTNTVDWDDFWDRAENHLDRDLGTDLLHPELVRAKKYIRKGLREIRDTE